MIFTIICMLGASFLFIFNYWNPSGYSVGKSIEDLTREKESLNCAKRKLISEISVFSGFSLEENLSLFRFNLISKLQNDLSNISNKKCKLKETAKLILKYNKIVNEFVDSDISWNYTIYPF